MFFRRGLYALQEGAVKRIMGVMIKADTEIQ